VSATRYKHDDTRPYLFKTADYGRTWTRVDAGLPAGEFTRVIREDPTRRGLLYCGTETGVWVSLDDGRAWTRLRGNLPVAPVHDLIVKDGDLVVATHGRSFWILDDLSPLHQMADAVTSADAHLFTPRRTVRWRAYRGHGMSPGPNREVAYRMAGSLGYGYRQVEAPTGEKIEEKLDAGDNPPNGVIVHYWLREAPAGEVTLAFLDADGKEIRSFTSKRPPAAEGTPPSTAGPSAGGGEEAPREPDAAATAAEEPPHPTKQAGANRFVWNLRGHDATKLPDNKGRGGSAEMLTAPRVPPGAYQVRLTVNGRALTQRVELVKDPRVAATDDDLRATYAVAREAHELLGRVHDAVLRLRDVRAQAESWRDRVAAPPIKTAAEALARALTAVEEELIQVRSDNPRMFPAKLNTRIGTVVGLIDYADAPPTQALRDLTADLGRRAETELGRLERLIAEDIARFNAQCREAAVPAIVPKPTERG
jgi:hypothetical protein